MAEFALNNVFSFETHAPALLGAKIKNATLKAMVDYSTATKFFNPNSQHANLYTYLPIGSPRDHTKYTYLIFETENGETKIFAKEWINLNTVELVVGNTTRVTIYNTSSSDSKKIRDLLMAAGYSSFSVDVVS